MSDNLRYLEAGSFKFAAKDTQTNTARLYSAIDTEDAMDIERAGEQLQRLRSYNNWRVNTTGHCPPTQLRHMFPEVKIHNPIPLDDSTRKRFRSIIETGNSNGKPGNKFELVPTDSNQLINLEMDFLNEIGADNKKEATRELQAVLEFFLNDTEWTDESTHCFAFPDAKPANFMMTDRKELRFIDLDGLIIEFDKIVLDGEDTTEISSTFRGIKCPTDPWFLEYFQPGTTPAKIRIVLRYMTAFAVACTMVAVQNKFGTVSGAINVDNFLTATKQTKYARLESLKKEFISTVPGDTRVIMDQLTSLAKQTIESLPTLTESMFAPFTDYCAAPRRR